MTEAADIAMRARAAISLYKDVMKSIARLDAAEGFNQYPVLKASAVTDGRIYTDEFGVSPALHFTLYQKALLARLEEERRALYGVITGAMGVTPAQLQRLIRDHLDIETGKDGAFESWAGSNVVTTTSYDDAPFAPPNEAEKAIFSDGDGGETDRATSEGGKAKGPPAAHPAEPGSREERKPTK